MSIPAKPTKPRAVWKTAQLFIGFFRDQAGKQREQAKVWSPNNASASIHADPAVQEAFVVVKSADGDAARDVQVKFRPNMIVLRRDCEQAWKGILVDEHFVRIVVGAVTIRVNHDGSIAREAQGETTWIEADGGVLKKTEFVEASMSPDGVRLMRRTQDNLTVIASDGVLSKARSGPIDQD